MNNVLDNMNGLPISDEHKKKIGEILSQTTIDFISKLPQLLENKLVSAALYTIGMKESSYGGDRVEVDLTNGRESVITKLIKTKIKEELEPIVIPLVDVALQQIKTDKKYIAGIAKYAIDEFQRAFRDAVVKEARTQAEAAAKTYVAAFVNKQEVVELLINPTSVESPNGFDTALGNLVLEEMGKIINGGQTPKVTGIKSEQLDAKTFVLYAETD